MIENIIKDYAFKSAFALWMISEIILYFITKYETSGKREDIKSSDRGSSIIITLGTTFCVTVSFFIRGQANWFLSDIYYYIGTACMLIGILFRWCAVFTLREYFSYSVVIKSNHHIVEKGLYKLLRHPAYTGFILILIGIPLSQKLILATLLAAVVGFAIFAYRIYIEEIELLNRFGDEYKIYCEHTWRIIPYIW